MGMGPQNILLGTGGDVAGEIVEVGSSVKNFKAGDKVVAIVDPRVSFSSPLICIIVTHLFVTCNFSCLICLAP